MVGAINWPQNQGISTAYPFSDIKDDTGIGDGSALSRETMLGDWTQYFEQLLSLTGMTPNGTLDNVTNGYQTIEALIMLIKLTVNNQVFYSNAGSLNGGIIIMLDAKRLYYINGGGSGTITVNMTNSIIGGEVDMWIHNVTAGNVITILGVGFSFLATPGISNLTFVNTGAARVKFKYLGGVQIAYEVYN